MRTAECNVCGEQRDVRDLTINWNKDMVSVRKCRDRRACVVLAEAVPWYVDFLPR